MLDIYVSLAKLKSHKIQEKFEETDRIKGMELSLTTDSSLYWFLEPSMSTVVIKTQKKDRRTVSFTALPFYHGVLIHDDGNGGLRLAMGGQKERERKEKAGQAA